MPTMTQALHNINVSAAVLHHKRNPQSFIIPLPRDPVKIAKRFPMDDTARSMLPLLKHSALSYYVFYMYVK